MIAMPSPLADYFDAANGDDADLIASFFSEDARVHDEKQDHVGRDAIRDWAADVRRKTEFQSDPFAINGDDAEPTVTAHVSGDFPGSPIDLTYTFKIANGAITNLSID